MRMIHVVQRHGVRLIAFPKSGHQSVVSSFLTPAGVSETEPDKNTLVSNSLQGGAMEARQWPQPVVTIAYIRHPMARIASVWNHLISLNWHPQFEPFGFNPGMPFHEFLKQLIYLFDNNEQHKHGFDPHLYPQALSFRTARGWFGDTWLGRIDEIEELWPQMVKTWGLDCTSIVANINIHPYENGLPWVSLYEGEEEFVGKLMNHYREDHMLWKHRSTAMLLTPSGWKHE